MIKIVSIHVVPWLRRQRRRFQSFCGKWKAFLLGKWGQGCSSMWFQWWFQMWLVFVLGRFCFSDHAGKHTDWHNHRQRPVACMWTHAKPLTMSLHDQGADIDDNEGGPKLSGHLLRRGRSQSRTGSRCPSPVIHLTALDGTLTTLWRLPSSPESPKRPKRWGGLKGSGQPAAQARSRSGAQAKLRPASWGPGLF